MAEGHESQELAIPSKGKEGIARAVRSILRKPAHQAIKQTPIGQTEIEISKGEMSVERAREILEYVVGLDERGLSPAEQLKPSEGIHYKYKDIQKAFGVYADHLVTTHGAKESHEAYDYRLLKEDLPGPSQNLGPDEVLTNIHYDLELKILRERDFKQPIEPKAVQLTLYDEKSHGLRKVQSRIPIVGVKPWSWDEREAGFWDILSLSDPINPQSPIVQEASFSSVQRSPIREDPERFHQKYKLLHRGMRWTAANLLCWDEKRIVYPDDLDKSLDKEQAQLSKPKLALPPKP